MRMLQVISPRIIGSRNRLVNIMRQNPRDSSAPAILPRRLWGTTLATHLEGAWPMTKIPVGGTIAQSFGFVFGRYFTLLGIAWLPMLILGAASFFVMQPYYRDASAVTANAEPTPLVGSHAYPTVLL